MESYNFDTIIDRQGTNTVAIDGQEATFGRDGLMPLWVADMDFETPSFIVEALQQRLNHHLYGYTIVPDAYWQAVQQWLFDRHGWQVERQWLSMCLQSLAIKLLFSHPCTIRSALHHKATVERWCLIRLFATMMGRTA